MNVLRTRPPKRDTSPAAPTAPRPRSPGVTYAVISLALFVAVAALSLSARATPPPTIAEYAPQAVEQISAESQQHEAGASERRGAAATDDIDPATGLPRTAEAILDVARVRRCVGDPPRQIEDPQSPPCVPYWSGDNGGATYQGVTRDEIRIAAPEYRGWGNQFTNRSIPVLDMLGAFFSKRFELYGRKIKVIDNTMFDDGSGSWTHMEQSAAVRADEEFKVFASLDEEVWGGFHYHEELARRKIPSTPMENLWSDELLARSRPYLWSYFMAPDRIFGMLGEWTCKRLAGGPAAHAGGLEAGKPRVYGIILQYQFHDQRLNSQALQRELAGCGIHAVAKFEYGIHEQGAEDPRNIILQMKSAGVTTIHCMCRHLGHLNAVQQEANLQAYFPEWLVSTYGAADANFWMRAFGQPGQLDHTFGLSMMPKQVRPQDQPSYWALQEMDPNTTTTEDGLFFDLLNQEYWAFLLLASGIQMAGPNLNPQTFAQGLHRARFPNPAHRIMAGAVGFNDGDFSMTEDAAEIWWSTTDKGPFADDAGTFCYVNGGTRYRKGALPSGGGQFFQQPCDSGRG